MQKFKQNIDFYIEQYDLEKQIFLIGKKVFKRGWLNKEEFLTFCLWKSRRPKKWYNLNSEQDIERLTKLSFSEKDEIKKITFLTELKGVSIPTASAILSIINPELYPIIDERCIQSLNKLGAINWTIINNKNWLNYLEIIRKLGKENNKPAREIEKGLFAYNRINLDKQYKNLYKNG
jgi:thermostable 8-oxoguanine DNA glycosylase